jgi:hypothetical protein
MSSRYYATISHHSISRAREVDVGDDLPEAIAKANQEFGDGFVDHSIVIYERSNGEFDDIVAEWKIADGPPSADELDS